MKIAVGSDQRTHLTQIVVEELEKRGHEVSLHGALVESEAVWPKVAVQVAKLVASHACEQAVLFCWTGTGIALAANKVPGIRAALCQDAQTASGARKWNDANILAMSLRYTSEEIAKEILNAWFSTPPSDDKDDQACLTWLQEFERPQTDNPDE
jgi:ribose 5-phosphate isomerase B